MNGTVCLGLFQNTKTWSLHVRSQGKLVAALRQPASRLSSRSFNSLLQARLLDDVHVAEQQEDTRRSSAACYLRPCLTHCTWLNDRRKS